MQKKKSEIDFTKSSHASATNIASKKKSASDRSFDRGGGQKEDCKSPEGHLGAGQPPPSEAPDWTSFAVSPKASTDAWRGSPLGPGRRRSAKKGRAQSIPSPAAFTDAIGWTTRRRKWFTAMHQPGRFCNQSETQSRGGRQMAQKKMLKNIALLTQRGHSNIFAPVFLFGTLGCPASCPMSVPIVHCWTLIVLRGEARGQGTVSRGGGVHISDIFLCFPFSALLTSHNPQTLGGFGHGKSVPPRVIK